MMPNILTGKGGSYRLIDYLFGPGRHNEHTDPHVVASWNNFAPDPGRNRRHTVSQLANQLDQPVKMLGDRAPKTTIWHCSLRAAPEDRCLDDAEWDDIARRVVHAVGLAREGDAAACRWVAVRHADDHIHIAATLVRQDGRRADLKFDRKKAHAEARRIEADYGLRELNPGDGTAAKRPTSPEKFKAERLGRTATPRETLREAVRQALSGAASEEEFFQRLREAGVRIKIRTMPSGDLQGYAVALPGDRNGAGEPVWFSGSTLAPDLSLPKIRQRLAGASAAAPEPIARDAAARRSRPAAARRHAVTAAEGAVRDLDCNGDEAAAQLAGAGELLDALAHTARTGQRTELAAAAREFERATRSHVRAEHAEARALRSAARGIVHAGAALGRGEDGGATAMLLSTLVLLTLAAAHWHSARGHAQQAAASRQAAEHLRTAYRQAATGPMKALQQHGRALPPSDRHRHQATIRVALPSTAASSGRLLGMDALAATLDQAERAGFDPEALVQEAIALRELDMAQDVQGVLVWRVRRLADLPAHPGAAPPTASGTRPDARRVSEPRQPAAVRPTAAGPRKPPPSR